MLDKYLASSPTVIETLASGSITKNKKWEVQRELERWQRDWEIMGVPKHGN
ncbi:hypothetical protein CGCS363_v011311 [Colletotrichum siamense]|uniref:uncharacterized protein n=1 Tax=Colletotrichum siamense TaxID=690259 RepID=UPI001872E77D|nr:uncharacterized protein CGCS363_v011311 [Colletotrichum siamense]KAF5492376.1 hypothetical protein CGCS363_v011311 [Colletotrichum siamense]